VTRATLRTLAAVLAVIPAAARAQSAAPDTTPAAAADSTRVPQAVYAAPVYGVNLTVTAPGTPDPLAAGDAVRVVSSAGRYAGTLTNVTADTLTLAAPGRLDALVRADISEMHRLVSRESRGGSILRGAGVGLLGGAVLGFVVGSAAGSGDCSASSQSCSPGKDKTAQAAFTIDGAVVGALVGAMLGPTFRRSRWERVDASPQSRPERVGTLPAPR